jgi:class 3 adenylate cyclase/tetratricopeptide (TPR) repeat protein
VAVCPRCTTENADSARFCSECGSPLAEPVAREQRKTVTVLFCDVTGSTALGERVDAEALRNIMSRYFDAARHAIERHGGTVEKFIGDAVMAVFGVPTLHEDDALRAVRAALELRDSVEVEVRIGVNTGEVVTGGVETLVTGDPVNVAARLEQVAAPGEILIGGETYALVRDVVDAELLPPLEVKGKMQTLTAYRLRAIAREASRRDAAPMVGRSRELEALAQAYARSRAEHACHLFTVLGTAGIGKSRLVADFLGGLPGARVVGGRCLSYGEGITYWPVVEVLKQLGTPVESVLRDGTTPPEIAWAVRKALERAALDVPLVVVFDDIQWGEATFLDLIEHVADLSRGAPILLLCMARPELLDVRPGWGGGKLNATSVLLEPLPRDDTESLVHALFADADADLVARIRDAADGNPLFVEEMVELARTSGGDVAVPPTIHALLTARLDSLPAPERAVLERGAVEGQVFHRNAVAALAPEEPQVDSRLVSLVRKELVRPDRAAIASDEAYRFRHLLIRDAAYEALPKATRIELHERFATWLDEHGADLVELDEIVGYHLEQAVRYGDELGRDDRARRVAAAGRLMHAAERARARGDAEATANLATRALTLLPEGDPGLPAARLSLGRALYECARLDEATAVLSAAVRTGDSVVSARARIALALIVSHASSSSFQRSRADIEGAIEDLADSPDDAALAEAHSARALLLFYEGRNGDARDAAALAVRHAERTGDVTLVGLVTETYGITLNWSDTPWPEIERFVAERFTEERVGERSRARVLGTMARAAWARCEFEVARSLLAESHRRLLDLGQTMTETSHWMIDADLERMAGDWEAMERAARLCWDGLGALGEHGYRSTGGALLAEALVRLDRLEDADAVLAEAESHASSDDYVTSYLVLYVRALAASRRGRHGEAVDLARRSLAVVDASDAPDHLAGARIAVAEVLLAAGRAGEAEAVVADGIRIAEAKGNRAVVERLRAVLAVAPQQ